MISKKIIGIFSLIFLVVMTLCLVYAIRAPVSLDEKLSKTVFMAQNNFTNQTSLEDKDYPRVVVGQSVKWTKKLNDTSTDVLGENKTFYEFSNGIRRNISEDEANKSKFNLASNVEYLVEYYTPGPKKSERVIDKDRKEVVVASAIHYQNVEAYTNIEKRIKIGDTSLIRVFWKENNTYLPFNINDFDNDGYIDSINWTIPHLSTQTFEIIVINAASHLDSNKNFIEDIYDSVREVDDSWSPTIKEGEFVRVIFEKQLDSKRDITIFPRIVSGNPKIEVYLSGTDIKVAEFDNLISSWFNKVYLNNLNETSDSFDLKVVDGSVEFNQIIDPSTNYLINTDASATATATTTGSFGGGRNIVRLDNGNYVSYWIDGSSDASCSLGTVGGTSWAAYSSETGTHGDVAIATNGTALVFMMTDETATQLDMDYIYRNTNTCDIATGAIADVNAATNDNWRSDVAYDPTNKFFVACSMDNDDFDIDSARAVIGATTLTWSVTPATGGARSVDSCSIESMIGGNVFIAGDDAAGPIIVVLNSTDNFTTTTTTTAYNAGVNDMHLNIRDMEILISAIDTTGSDLIVLNSSNNGTTYSNSTLAGTFTEAEGCIDQWGWYNLAVGDGADIYYVQFRNGVFSDLFTFVNTANPARWPSVRCSNFPTSNRMDGGELQIVYTETTSNDVYFANFTVPTNRSVFGNPLVNITLPLNITYNVSSLQFNISLNEAGFCNFTFNIGNSNYTMDVNSTENGFNYTNSSILPGNYTMTALCEDFATNINRTMTRTFQIRDILKPNITFVNQTSLQGAYPSDSIWANVSVSDDFTTDKIVIYLYNSTGLVNSSMGSGPTYFINFTGLPQGNYYLNATVNDTSGNLNSTATRNINLTDLIPPIIDFINPISPSSASSLNSFLVNVSLSENGNSVWYSLSNGATNISMTSVSPTFWNATNSSTPDGNYTLIVWANDTVNNTGRNQTFILIDTVVPQLSYISPTQNNGSYVPYNWTFINISVTELNLANITFRIYNSTSLVNSTTFSDSRRSINFTSLNLGTYFYNVTVFDLAGNSNFTPTYNITLDTLSPSVTASTPPNNTIVNVSSQNLTLSATDNFGIKNATLYVYNQVGTLVNQTTIALYGGLSPVVGVVVTLADGLYNWFYRLFDNAGNVFDTQNRTITIDTVSPQLTVDGPLNYINLSNPDVNITYSASDNRNLTNCSLYFDGILNQTNNSVINSSLSQFNLYALSIGEHNWSIRCLDEASNYIESNNEFFNVIFRVQRASTSMTAATLDVFISPVNQSKAFILLSTRSASDTPNILHVTGTFLNDSVIRLQKNSATATSVEWEVIEGVSINVQRGESTTSTTAINNITINFPNPVELNESFVIVTGRINTATAANNVRDFWTSQFINSSWFNVTRGVTGTAATASWQVVSWDSAVVQMGVFTSSAAPTFINLANAVNLSQSFIYSNKRSSTTSAIDTMARVYFANSSQIALDRAGATGTTTVSYFVVSTPQISTQSGSLAFSATTAQDVSINLVNTSSAFTLSSSKYGTANTNYGRAFVTDDLTNSTNIQLQKLGGTDTVTSSWFLANFMGLDQTVPQLNIVSPVQYANYSSPTVLFNITSDEFLDTCIFSLDNGTTNTTFNKLNYTLFTYINTSVLNATYFITYYCNDTSGNLNVTRNIFSVDMIAPNIDFITQTLASGNYSQNFIWVNVSAVDSIVGIDKIRIFLYNSTSLVNSTMVSSSSPYFVNFTNLPDGTYFLNATANDTLGNTNNTGSGTRIIRLDRTAPNITSVVQSLAAGNYTQGAIWANFTSIDNLVGVANITIYLYNSTALVNLTTTSGPFNFVNYTGLPDGIYYVNATTNDTVGNLNSSGSGTKIIRIDRTAPNVDFISQTLAVGNYSQGFIWANVSAVDSIVGIDKIRIYLYNSTNLVNSTMVSSSSPYFVNFTNLPDGTYFLNATANDTVGNINNTGSGTRKIILDRISPNIDFVAATTLASGNYSRNFIEANVTANETLSGLDKIRIYLYNSTNLVNSTMVSSSSPYFVNFTNLPDGTYFLNATANDTAGNLNSSGSGTRTIRLDKTAPNITSVVQSLAAGNYSLNAIWANYTSIDNLVGVANITIYLYNTTSLVNSTMTSGPFSFVNYTSLPEGTYFINATTNDTVGNLNSSGSGTKVIIIDRTAPNVDFIAATLANGSYSQNFIWVNVSANDSFVGIDKIRIYLYNSTNLVNSTMVSSSSPYFVNFTNLPDGTYYLNATANDTVGNINNTGSGTRNILLDRTAPSLQIVYPLNQTYSVLVNQLNYTVSDLNGVNSCWYSTNFGTTNITHSSCNGTIDGINSSEGLNNWTVWANDSLGNLNVSRVSFTISIAYPNISFVSPTVSNGNYSSNFILVNVSSQTVLAIDKVIIYLYNSSGLINTSIGSLSNYFVNFTSLAEGLYSFNATVNDTSGKSNTTETRTIRLDRTAPNISFISPTLPDGGNYSQNFISVNVSAIDDYSSIANITVYLYNATKLVNSSMGSSSPYFVNFTNLIDGTYFLNATANDTVGNINNTGSGTRTIRLDKTAPSIDLMYPVNNSNITGYNVTRFGINTSDVNIVNCSLWGNWNGGWHLNQSIIAQKNIEENFTSINTSQDGHYIWAVNCIDNFGNSNWSVNRTFSTYQVVDGLNESSITITQDSNFGNGTTTLHWNSVAHNEFYEIYYTTNLNQAFTYLNRTSLNNYTDINANLSRRIFYKVNSVNPISISSGTQIFGKTIYNLEKIVGVGTKNWINFYLNNPNLTNANQTLLEFGNITNINYWNSTIQKRVTCNYFSCPDSFSCTETNCNFNINDNQSYEVNLNTSSTNKINWSYVGALRNSSTINLTKNITSFGRNWVGMYGNTTKDTAIKLIQNISNADALSKWNSSSQKSLGLTPNPFPFIPVPYLGDFNITPEEGIEVSVNVSTGWRRV